MGKLKIMLFTDWYEPGFKAGGPIRSCVNFASNMKDEYSIFIFTGDRDTGDQQGYPNIQINCWTAKEGIRIFYASPLFLKWRNILREIQKIQPDFLYLNNMYSRYFTIYPLWMKRRGLINARIVLAPRGMLQEGAIQFKSVKKKVFLSLLRWLSVPPYIMGHATDEQESKDIRKYLPRIQSVNVIPNFSSPLSESFAPIRKCKGELLAIFISRISPKKNILFFLSLLPRLSRNSYVHLTVRGSMEDATYWKSCMTSIQELPEQISVRYEGPIDNREVISLIQQHHLFVLPTLGENFGHAIFEALSAGRPVLISDRTPWRNLQDVHAGWDLPLNDQKAFIKVLQEIADMDDETYQQWSRGAWDYAKGFSDNSGLKEKYKGLFS